MLLKTCIYTRPDRRVFCFLLNTHLREGYQSDATQHHHKEGIEEEAKLYVQVALMCITHAHLHRYLNLSDSGFLLIF